MLAGTVSRADDYCEGRRYAEEEDGSGHHQLVPVYSRIDYGEDRARGTEESCAGTS